MIQRDANTGEMMIQKRIHGGAAQAWLKPGVSIDCNAYCDPERGVHCDVNWGTADWTEEQALMVARTDPRLQAMKVRVLRVERTYEAEPPDEETHFRAPGAPQQASKLSAWLTFWEVIDRRS